MNKESRHVALAVGKELPRRECRRREGERLKPIISSIGSHLLLRPLIAVCVPLALFLLSPLTTRAGSNSSYQNPRVKANFGSPPQKKQPDFQILLRLILIFLKGTVVHSSWFWGTDTALGVTTTAEHMRVSCSPDLLDRERPSRQRKGRSRCSTLPCG